MTSPGSWYPLRGEVYWLDFDPSIGAEMQALHPALIVQNDVGNQRSDLTIIVAITSNTNLSRLPVCVSVPAGEAGLTIDSVVHCGHIYTVDQSRLGHKLGILGSTYMDQVDRALKRSLKL
jgi:mRNA interferase MazF